MGDAAKRWFKRARWLEPSGQFVVLAAAGFQLFVVEPANSNYLRAVFDDLYLASARIESKFGGYGVSSKDRDLLDRDTFVAKLNSNDERRAAESTKRALTPLFASMFIIGSLLAVLGKAASVKSSS